MHATLTYPTLPVGRFFTKEGVRGYRFGFNGQMKDDEVYGEGNSYTAEFWQYDPRLGRRWNVDPKPNPSISNYAAFGNNPIGFTDVLGDTIKNAVTDIVNQKTQLRDNAQTKYDGLISAHQGDLKNNDVRRYRKESGLKSAEKDLAHWQGIENNINSMIETFKTVMPKEFNELNSLSTNILIGYSSRTGPSGELNPAATLIPVNVNSVNQFGSNTNYNVWSGDLKGDIQITLYGGGHYSPFRTNFLANEFGDIDYFFKNVIPNDPISFQKWVTTGSSKYPGYWNDPTGAGQMSFKYQYNFEAQFKITAKNYPNGKVDFNNWLIHK